MVKENSSNLLLYHFFFLTLQNQRLCYMKNTLIISLMCLAACFILPGCEKEVVDEFPQMEEFYQESKGLVSVTVDSVKLFKSKVDGFVATYPLAVEHEKYPLTRRISRLPHSVLPLRLTKNGMVKLTSISDPVLFIDI